MTRKLATATTLTALLASFSATAEHDHYPRLAGANYGSPQDYENTTYQAQLAKLDLSILSIWVGWEVGRNTTYDQMIRNIKKINPEHRVFAYINNNELQYPDTPNVKMDMRTMLDNSKSWLYAAGGSGTMVKSTWGNNFYITNTTAYSPKDSNGRTWVEAYAYWTVDKFAKPNPALDGFFLDNVFWRPRVDGDWNRDGVIDSKDSSTTQAWFRQGLRRHFEVARQLMPGKYQIGNIADWGQAGKALPEFDQQLNGGLLENIIGPSHAVETWGGWSEMMKRYRSAIAMSSGPKYVIFNHWGSATDYQGMRYGLASCLMDNGYFAFSVWDGDSAHIASYRQMVWFDEFNAELGMPISSPPTTAWSQGVYRRDYEGGVVLVNPKGNGIRTVTLEADFKRIAGTQDPSVNNGQTTRTVTLRDRDGIILLKGTPSKRPMAPTDVNAR